MFDTSAASVSSVSLTKNCSCDDEELIVPKGQRLGPQTRQEISLLLYYVLREDVFLMRLAHWSLSVQLPPDRVPRREQGFLQLITDQKVMLPSEFTL